jgi:hypothetical protein
MDLLALGRDVEPCTLVSPVPSKFNRAESSEEKRGLPSQSIFLQHRHRDRRET